MDHALEMLRESWEQAILWTPAGYERGHAFYEALGWALPGVGVVATLPGCLRPTPERRQPGRDRHAELASEVVGPASTRLGTTTLGDRGVPSPGTAPRCQCRWER